MSDESPFTAVFTMEDDEHLRVSVGTTDVAWADHDEDGWAGIDQVKSIFKNLERLDLCRIEYRYGEVEVDEE
jgi:hypothetical protein